MARITVERAHALGKEAAREKADKLAEVDRMVPQAVAAIKKVLEDPKLADEMMAEVVPLYARYFTADEMKRFASSSGSIFRRPGPMTTR